MKHFHGSIVPILVLSLASALPLQSLSAQAIIANHTSVGQFAQIPHSVLDQIRADYRFYYAHTSHGSQIVTGMNMLAEEDPIYTRPSLYEVGDDLGLSGDTSWAPPLRVYLNGHPEITAVMLSWCGGVSDNTVEGINTYLNTMSDLEQDYPGITFVYITGHLDGSGDDGNLNLRNEQIRAYCIANAKVLFDFADIETYDPDGVRYPDATDACEWCYDWCAVYTCPYCPSCAHSHCFNCYQKGKAFWWMMARVAGWSTPPQYCCEGRVGDANGDGEYPDDVTLGDIMLMVDVKFISGDCGKIACLDEADVNQDGGATPSCEDHVTLGDIMSLVDFLFITGPENAVLPDCL